jgi:hypothetical protein
MMRLHLDSHVGITSECVMLDFLSLFVGCFFHTWGYA